MNRHPNLDMLVAFVLGELDADAASHLQRRVAESPELASALERVQRMCRALDERELEDLSPSLHQRLRALLSAKPATQPTWVETATQVLRLLLDTRVAPARGFRSFATDETFLLTFGGPELNVDVQVSPAAAPTPDAPGRWALRGCAEIDGRTQTAEIALLPAGTRPPLFTATDEHGQFALETPQGACSLAIKTGQRVFTTPPFDIP